jgi:sulfate transport system permease protein
MNFQFRPYSKMTFSLVIGLVFFYTSIIIIIPIIGLFVKTFEFGISDLVNVFYEKRIQDALILSFGTSLVAALINMVLGFLFAWTIVRYEFPGKQIINSLIDLPFMLPTAVAGISLTSIYSNNGWIGSFFHSIGIQIAYTPIGIIIALVFVGFPFVVRSIQPVLEELPKELEESAYCLGATRFQTFYKIILPYLIPSCLSGASMAFARGVGEYGSVVFISGNIPNKTEILPLLIITKLEQYEYAQATSIALLMLSLSFSIMLLLNFWQARRSRYLS